MIRNVVGHVVTRFSMSVSSVASAVLMVQNRSAAWKMAVSSIVKPPLTFTTVSFLIIQCSASAGSGMVSIGLSVAKSNSLNLKRSSRPFVKRIEWRNSLPRLVLVSSTSSYCHSG